MNTSVGTQGWAHNIDPGFQARRIFCSARSDAATVEMAVITTTAKAKTLVSKLRATASFDVGEIAGQMLGHRAVEAVIWGMPAVTFDLLYRAMVQVGGAWNELVYWSRLISWKNQTLTPNPDVIYVFPFFDTKEAGPMVMEIPPADGGSITGSVDDAWQSALEDVGPAGVDKGKGGKYLILPPDYKDGPPEGYIVLQSDTYRSYAILRSNL